MVSDLWFDEISLAYAKNFEELEAARARFDQQRQEVIDSVEPLIRSVARQRDLPLGEKALSGRDSTGAWINVPVIGRYAAIHARPESASGIGCGLGAQNFWADNADVPLAVYTYLSFTMDKAQHRALALEKNLRDIWPSAREVRRGGGGVYVVTSALSPAAVTFSLEGIHQVIEDAVNAFPKLDEWIANRMAGGGGSGA